MDHNIDKLLQEAREFKAETREEIENFRIKYLGNSRKRNPEFTPNQPPGGRLGSTHCLCTTTLPCLNESGDK